MNKLFSTKTLINIIIILIIIQFLTGSKGENVFGYLILAFTVLALFVYMKEKNDVKLMKDYRGVIIEESLINKDVLKKVQILETNVKTVTEKHKTPWVKQWTLHTVLIPEDQAKDIAEEIRMSLDKEHNWYADYRNMTHHYIIFNDRVFYIDRKNIEEYNLAKQHGISLGIPEYQVDFHPDIKEWKK